MAKRIGRWKSPSRRWREAPAEDSDPERPADDGAAGAKRGDDDIGDEPADDGPGRRGSRW